ncbi:hypothetical protein QIO56_gp3 [ssRNA phage Gerhypos.4_31]|uniref:Uncharacterized protein n=1 Tax=ssRNA phage Gerhypos.4_31 TaxID=2786333 RepID=A0A8S5L3T8_9VIRU|nr:hypothetical protein QIO56_gp3 [ssRNA phage Gerhypos.4_31]DAD52084.1 TPA_asm: hypothetical protein [ssRNA phage Gerhypos.4_31]
MTEAVVVLLIVGITSLISISLAGFAMAARRS